MKMYERLFEYRVRGSRGSRASCIIQGSFSVDFGKCFIVCNEEMGRVGGDVFSYRVAARPEEECFELANKRSCFCLGILHKMAILRTKSSLLFVWTLMPSYGIIYRYVLLMYVVACFVYSLCL